MKNKIIKFLAGIFFIFLACTFFSLYSSKYFLETEHYTVTTDQLDSPIRIVQLTDLHNSVFGEDNSKLIDMVKEQMPDVIFLTGDMVNEGEEDTSIAENLVRQLCQIAPVYYSYGNHELGHEENWNSDFASLMTEAGAAVLEYDYVDTQIKGQQVRIGGIYGYCLPDMKSNEDFEEETVFLKEFQNTDHYKILLCHMPVCWMINTSLNYWDIDLVFAGHAHGGQVRIPFVGGLYAPDNGWFPGWMEGIFDSEDGDKHLILSRGLGTTEKIPRVNNVPEVLVLDVEV